MRLHPIFTSALYTSAVLLGEAYADIAEEIVESATSIAESATSSVAERPTFTVSTYSSIFARCGTHQNYVYRDAKPFKIALEYQSTVLRTIHRRLGLEVGTVSCQETRLQG